MSREIDMLVVKTICEILNNVFIEDGEMCIKGEGLTVLRDALLSVQNNAMLRDLVQTLLTHDPAEPIADNGMTVLDGWRERASRVLREQDVNIQQRGET